MSRKLPRRRHFCLLLLVGLGSCFPAPVRELWPPEDGERWRQVDVMYRDWHTFIVYGQPDRQPDRETEEPKDFFEWEFAEKAWYLEGKQGITGVFRALFWPTDSAVKSQGAETPYWVRHSERDVKRWTFVVSERGWQRMVAYLESQKGEALAVSGDWYAGNRSYHSFFLCHHFTLAALREAGLPVAPWWGYTAWMAEIQLDRVSRFHEREARRRGTFGGRNSALLGLRPFAEDLRQESTGTRWGAALAPARPPGG